MAHTNVTQLSHASQLVQEWLKDLASRPPFETEDQAYSYLRAVLHALRDRLTVEQVAHLASQLPMVVRGFYYEGWRPSLAPNDFHTQQEFFDHVEESLGGTTPATRIDTVAATHAVLGLLEDRVDEGELRHVKSQLPEDIRNLFAQPTVSG